MHDLGAALILGVEEPPEGLIGDDVVFEVAVVDGAGVGALIVEIGFVSVDPGLGNEVLMLGGLLGETVDDGDFELAFFEGIGGVPVLRDLGGLGGADGLLVDFVGWFFAAGEEGDFELACIGRRVRLFGVIVDVVAMFHL